MPKLKTLSIYYKKNVNNLANQSRSFNKLMAKQHKMNHRSRSDYASALKEVSELPIEICNSDHEAQNYDFEKYINWLGNDEFTRY